MSKVVFFGTGEFAIPALRAVADHVVLVVTQPDRPTGRGMRLQPSPIKMVGEELGLMIQTPPKSRDPLFVEKLEELRPDMLLVASYGQILSQRMLDCARIGGINLHGSILPKYRGAAPIQRCILDGETQTGITLMQMDKGMDTGDIIHIERTPIDPDETYSALQARLGEIAGLMAKEWLAPLLTGDYSRIPQDNERATIAPKVLKEEAELSFDRGAHGEYNRFRAFTASPGAFLNTRLGRIKLSQCGFSERSGEPGTLLDIDLVAFQDGSIRLLEIQPEGKKRMSGKDFANGMRLNVGMSLLK